MTNKNEQQIKSKKGPVVLLVLDGFGVNISIPNSTWSSARRPTFNKIEKHWPFTTLQASGIAVGLPWNEPGNSEIGHLTIGAGKILYHHLPRIISSINDGTFFDNEALLLAVEKAKESGSKLHLMGIFSSGSVHAYIEHLYALLDLVKKNKVREVYLHLFGDGKDAPPKELSLFLKKFQEKLKDYSNVKIGSLLGRNYAMDRDEKWDKVKKAYNLLTKGEGSGEAFIEPLDHVQKSYEKEVTDADILPGFLADENGKPLGRIENNDAVIFYNFREDSVRELTSSFIDDRFNAFERGERLNILFVTMTEYEKRFTALVAFPSLDLKWPLSRVISDAGLKQLHIAETNKYAHVTYFFNGGREKPFPGEERILVPSLNVANFEDRPEMSASKITEAIIDNLSKYDFIVANFANGDLVGHTGNFEATVRAIEVLDFSIGKILLKVLEAGGSLVITADHGNAEEKRYRITGEKRTQHTNNPVPFYIITNDSKKNADLDNEEIDDFYRDVEGVLTDVAPTILELMGLKKPSEMSGESLVDKLFK